MEFEGKENYRSGLNGLTDKEKTFLIERELESKVKLLNQLAIVIEFAPDGEITRSNQKLSQVTGYDTSDIVGKNFKSQKINLMPGSVFRSMWNTIHKGEIWQGMINGKNLKDEDFWLICSIAPYFSEDKKIEKFILIAYDVSEQKNMEEKVRQDNMRISEELHENMKYAKNIQRAVLQDTFELTNIFPDSFLHYQPLHFVSGDFYWFNSSGSSKVVVLGDCMGHGVSASYVSILLLQYLQLFGVDYNVTEPTTCFNLIDHKLKETLQKNKNSSIYETADIAYCKFDLGLNRLNYLSFGITILIIRNGEVITLNKERRSIGESNRNITNQSAGFKLEKHDKIYIFSDGIIHQFGGPNDKKFGIKRLKDLLLNISDMAMRDQQKYIKNKMNEWIGDSEQTDDMTIMGINYIKRAA